MTLSIDDTGYIDEGLFLTVSKEDNEIKKFSLLVVGRRQRFLKFFSVRKRNFELK